MPARPTTALASADAITVANGTLTLVASIDAQEDAEYEHNLRWHDGNGYSHVRAALLASKRSSTPTRACPPWRRAVPGPPD